MFSLSRESEQDLAHGILELIEKYHKVCNKVPQRLTGLISAKRLQDELDISYKTLHRWEEAGLRPYRPPLEETRKVYYKVSDIRKFMGVENG